MFYSKNLFKKYKKVILANTICLIFMMCICACGMDDVASTDVISETGDSTEDSIASEISAITSDITEQTYFATPEVETAQSSIYVEKIDGLKAGFIRGMDISSLLAQEASGVKYYDALGNEADLFKILADAGVNCIRVRVWNDPYDSDGHGYGGGNCDVNTAAVLGSRAAEYGIKLSVDFHYSDFWADPNKQFAPKAWKDMDFVAKSEAIYSFTYDSLIQIINAGADVYMVQIGNETNTGLAGETDFDDIIELIRSGADAVRDVNYEWNEYELAKVDNADDALIHEIKVASHYTNIDNRDGTIEVAKRFSEAGLNIDVFGVSYYPYWHGTLDNMEDVLTTISREYGYETCVMETAYMYTGEDSDGSPNSVSDADELAQYPISIQGQANCVRDVMNAASNANAIGVFYWEGAWISVDSSGKDNSKIWEEYGSGWASSYAGQYDPDDAGMYYGGSSWDNQAFFDKEGKVLDSINVFKYVDFGAIGGDVEVLGLNDVELVFSPGDELVLPDKVQAVYNDSSIKDGMSVSWLEEDIANVNMKEVGEYDVRGTVALKESEDGYVHSHIVVKNINYVVDAGFEESELGDVWVTTSMTDEDPTDIQNKAADAYSGSRALHYWSEKAMEFEVSQKISIERNGSYKLSAYMQGGDFGDSDEIVLFARVNRDGECEEYKSDVVVLDGWVNWKNPVISGIEAQIGDEIEIGVYTKAQAKAWATYDDFELVAE